ncbi:MAG: pantetheine-phosphate adenylyltransferase [Acidimicrobiia bacterium]|nr:pantetheine-phosphate adenylyltransferase [Acidimicrobiia bacterium]
MTTALCPGSFDPPTNGHIDVIRRTARFADRIVVGVVGNPSKRAMFTPERRVELFDAVIAGWTDNDVHIEVIAHDGLVVDLVESHDIDVIVKGLRGTIDFENEQRMAHMNSTMVEVETLFLPTSPEVSFISSSLVREIATLGGSVDHLVPPPVRQAIGETR